MKKIMALVLFVSATLAFTGCSKDDNDPIPVDDIKYEGTWEADQLSYVIPGKDGRPDIPMKHPYVDFPDDNHKPILTQTDKLVLTKDTAVLTEYFVKNNGEPIETNGTVKDNVITFEKAGYSPRKITGTPNGQLSLTYDIDMRGAKLPVTVTYNRKK